MKTSFVVEVAPARWWRWWVADGGVFGPDATPALFVGVAHSGAAADAEQFGHTEKSFALIRLTFEEPDGADRERGIALQQHPRHRRSDAPRTALTFAVTAVGTITHLAGAVPPTSPRSSSTMSPSAATAS